MFTGLIEEIGRVARVQRAGDGLNLVIEAALVLEGTRTGDSICINGACQTVTAMDARTFTVFASGVTAAVTTLGGFAPGRRVNLERAMTPASRFGGHFVQGHVDGRGSVASIDRDRMGMGVTVSAGPELRRYIVEKGSIAVDGVSLTVVSLTPAGFTLYIIPGTLNGTVIPEWRAGDSVNIETDILAKYVERMLDARGQGGVTDGGGLMTKLAEGGFV
ncbi:MAG TPA: riboflavin synthase [Spirochaetota bacterium]|nr:riboflavin synthase [Spirochaetota bacterium]HOD14048.1 riboflavin synthase [Spirochaetota bacterium]HPG49336.1 riboflavin synthase [Spirochaetota bacterium]HPN13696.1 riboflavin synthase [Spirochaetota bacterium]